jgi:hypothetical protein
MNKSLANIDFGCHPGDGTQLCEVSPHLRDTGSGEAGACENLPARARSCFVIAARHDRINQGRSLPRESRKPVASQEIVPSVIGLAIIESEHRPGNESANNTAAWIS